MGYGEVNFLDVHTKKDNKTPIGLEYTLRTVSDMTITAAGITELEDLGLLFDGEGGVITLNGTKWYCTYEGNCYDWTTTPGTYANTQQKIYDIKKTNINPDEFGEYTINSEVIVPEGGTLTIPNQVNLKFGENGKLTMGNYAHLFVSSGFPFEISSGQLVGNMINVSFVNTFVYNSISFANVQERHETTYIANLTLTDSSTRIRLDAQASNHIEINYNQETSQAAFEALNLVVEGTGHILVNGTRIDYIDGVKQ